MTLYDFFMIPLEKLFFSAIRRTIIKEASGNVLEIGFGSGVNHRYYDLNNLESLTVVDKKLTKKCKKNITYIQCSVENLPFADNSFDTVVATLLLCSVHDVQSALLEINRVLKNNGQYIFLEHVRPKNKLGKLFDIINILWGKNPSGCQLNKNTSTFFHNSPLLLKTEFSKGALYYGSAYKK